MRIFDVILILTLVTTATIFLTGEKTMNIDELYLLEECLDGVETGEKSISSGDSDFLYALQEREEWEPLTENDSDRLHRIARELRD